MRPLRLSGLRPYSLMNRSATYYIFNSTTKAIVVLKNCKMKSKANTAMYFNKDSIANRSDIRAGCFACNCLVFATQHLEYVCAHCPAGQAENDVFQLRVRIPHFRGIDHDVG